VDSYDKYCFAGAQDGLAAGRYKGRKLTSHTQFCARLVECLKISNRIVRSILSEKRLWCEIIGAR
jgi:hypothetical protein